MSLDRYMDETGRFILRRRNGRLQACDPCRSRKVSCDHRQPTCTRCTKRKEEHRCVYTLSHTIDIRPPPRTPVLPSPKRHHGNLGASPPPSPAPLRLNGASDPSAISAATTSVAANGYLGFTSHTAIFEETQNNLPLHGSELSLSTPSPGAGPRLRPRDIVNSPLLREMCLQVLRQLKEQMPAMENTVFMGLPCFSDPWAHIAVNCIEDALQGPAFGRFLRPTSNDSDLLAMAEIVCQNTAAPLRSDLADPQEWLAQFTSGRLRWESLGLLWSLWTRKRSGHVLDGRLDVTNPQSLLCLESLDCCIKLAKSFCEGNTLLLDLCSRRTIIESLVFGDASLPCWISHGESVSLLTFLGLHDIATIDDYKPTLCSELERRIFARVLTSDVTLSSFTGRPTLISRRHCSTPVPLDLRDEDLLSDPGTIARAVQQLDERGWATEGHIYNSTFVRARMMLVSIKDEVVAIALSHQLDTTVEHLLSIKARQHETMSQFPRRLIYEASQLQDPNSEPADLYAQILLRLEFLQTDFLIERLKLRLSHPDDSSLLSTSFDMVSLTLLFWTEKDRFILSEHANHPLVLEWQLMAYAAPAGGVLCLELLQPTIARRGGPTRSDIVQKLSLLVGFFGWVRPSAPNGDMCARCKTVVQRVLDHTLNAQAAGAPGEVEWGGFPQPEFDFGLLDAFDWLPTGVGGGGAPGVGEGVKAGVTAHPATG